MLSNAWRSVQCLSVVRVVAYTYITQTSISFSSSLPERQRMYPLGVQFVQPQTAAAPRAFHVQLLV